MSMIKKCVFLAGIFICFTASSWALTLKSLDIHNSSELAKVILSFDRLPPFRIVKNNDREFHLIFKRAIIDVSAYPKSIEEGMLDNIDITRKDSNLILSLTFVKPVSLTYSKVKNCIVFAFKPQSSPKDASKEPFIIPEAPKRILFPNKKSTYHGQKISIDVQDADVQNVLRLLAKIGGFNLVLSDDVQGKITLSLHNVPWDQVLDIVLASKSLGMVKRGNVIRIAPLKTLQAETEQLAQIKASISKEESVAPLKTAYLQVNYAKAGDLAKQIQALLTERGSVTYDERTNKIILKDVPSVIKKAKDLIAKLDEPVKQVLIEAKIVEISDNFEHRLGIRWTGAAMQINNGSFVSASPANTVTLSNKTLNGATIGVTGVSPPISTSTSTSSSTTTSSSSSGSTGTTGIGPSAIVDLGVIGQTSLGLTWGTISQHSALLLDVQLSAMEEEGLAKIISSPKIITMDHLPAEINQGFKIPYLEQTQDGISTKFIDAGLSLKVIPHVTPDNRIGLEINVEKSAPDWSNTVNGVPTIVTRAAKSKVLVENGETIVIGGIKTEDLSETHGKVPGLGDIPGLGKLFRNKEYQNRKAELLIFITARVVSADIKDVDY